MITDAMIREHGIDVGLILMPVANPQPIPALQNLSSALPKPRKPLGKVTLSIVGRCKLTKHLTWLHMYRSQRAENMRLVGSWLKSNPRFAAVVYCKQLGLTNFETAKAMRVGAESTIGRIVRRMLEKYGLAVDEIPKGFVDAGWPPMHGGQEVVRSLFKQADDLDAMNWEERKSRRML